MTKVHTPSLVGASDFYRVADEFMNRLAETPAADVPKLLAEYPEHAEQLERLLPAMQTLISFGREPGGASREDGAQLHAPLGDFQLIREIGRGGMGVVYEAEQISLGRRMAVKILPLASILDPRQLQRFRHEATACALLKHPNIVSIHSVGCDRGVYFYAMELVDGQTLAEVIATRAGVVPANASRETVRAEFDATARPADFFAEVARLGIQAAEALDHAHERGIVHRDIKPSNLMVDASGRLWVTDFGLAHIESGPTLTITGDVLGTLRYMSPEQASGRPTMVDHRTDIYSLGATLYELATGSPVVTGQERASILREITETEPTSPRKLTPAMPVDLETILLKCLSKEPSARYDTAQALADDLRRFLEHKPVVARRPSVWDRTKSWGRRHQGTVFIAMAILAATTVGTTIAALLIAQAQRETEAARLKVEASNRLARQAVDDMYTGFAKNWLHEQPRLTLVQQQFLDKAATFYEELAEETPQDAESQYELAKRLQDVVEISHRLQDMPRARKAAERMLEICSRLHQTHPETEKYASGQATALNSLGGTLEVEGRLDDAETAFVSAIAIWEDLLRDDPAHEARRANLAGTYQNLGSRCFHDGRHEQACMYLTEALRHVRALRREHPEKVLYREDLARVLVNLGSAQCGLQSYDEAAACYDEAIEDLQTKEGETPSAEMRALLAGTLYTSVQFLGPNGMAHEAAIKRLTRSLELQERLVAEFPDVPVYRSRLQSCRNMLRQAQP